MVCYSYFNDTVGAAGFAAYTDLIFSFYAKKFVPHISFPKTAVLMLICGIIWEYAVPFFRKDTVSDPLDMIAYIVGGIIYQLVFLSANAMLTDKINQITRRNKNENKS